MTLYLVVQLQDRTISQVGRVTSVIDNFSSFYFCELLDLVFFFMHCADITLLSVKLDDIWHQFALQS